MRRHLEAKHYMKNKDRAFFQTKADVYKWRRYEDQGEMQQLKLNRSWRIVMHK